MSQAQVSWIELQVPDPVPFGPGCPPGSVGATFPNFPYVGAPFVCPTGTCGTGNTSAPGTPLQFRWLPLCNGRLNAAAPPGTEPQFGSLVLSQVTGMLDRWRQQVRPNAPGLSAGSAAVNPGSGHITLALAPPDEGPVVPSV